MPFIKSTGPSFFAECYICITSKQWPSTKLLNYLILVGKLFFWDYRRIQIHPKIKGYLNKIAKKK